MRRAAALLLTMAVACGGSSPDATPDAVPTTVASEMTYVPVDGSLEAVIPVGTVPAEVYTVRPSPRLAALMNKLQSNPDAYRQQVERAVPGEALPYDPSLGMTEAEFDEMLGLVHDLDPTKVDDSTFTVTREGSAFRFDGGVRLSDLDGVTVDLEANSVTTPFGVADVRSVVAPTDVDPEEAPWAWAGVKWQLQGGTDARDLDVVAGRSIRFNLGRRQNDGVGFLLYHVRVIEDGAKTESIDVILTFPAPG